MYCVILEKITHLTIVKAIKEIPAHLDVPLSQRQNLINQDCEPGLFKILLNKTDYDNSLFCVPNSTQTQIEDATFIEIPGDTNIFSLSENFYPHGAIFNPNTRRILVNVHGILDKHRVLQLHQQSFEKYEALSIRYPVIPCDFEEGHRVCAPV